MFIYHIYLISKWRLQKATTQYDAEYKGSNSLEEVLACYEANSVNIRQLELLAQLQS